MAEKKAGLFQAEFILDSDEAQKFLKDLSGRVDAITNHDKKVIGLLSSIVYRDIIDHFSQESGSDGPWKPWSDRYAAFMASIGKSGNKILQDTGRLRQAFQPSNVRSTSDGLLWFNPAKTSSGFPYAAAHDEGGGRLPQRQFMWLSKGALSEIESQIVKFLEDR